MGGRGGSFSGSRSNKALSSALKTITYDPNWLYQPDDDTDLSDMRKNPIPFVGIGTDTKLGYEIEDDTIQTDYQSSVTVDVSKLETLQPFVLASGIDNYQRFDGTDTPYVVQYQGHYYVMDGNHRLARAKLQGQKTVVVDLSVRQHK